MTTIVTNLRTGQKLEYTCAPEVAVVCAHEQARGNMNTWTYDLSQARTAGTTVYYGDWAASI